MGAELVEASLVGADLHEADALHANMRGADLSPGQISPTPICGWRTFTKPSSTAHLRATTMPDGTTQP